MKRVDRQFNLLSQEYIANNYFLYKTDISFIILNINPLTKWADQINNPDLYIINSNNKLTNTKIHQKNINFLSSNISEYWTQERLISGFTYFFQFEGKVVKKNKAVIPPL